MHNHHEGTMHSKNQIETIKQVGKYCTFLAGIKALKFVKRILDVAFVRGYTGRHIVQFLPGLLARQNTNNE